MEAHVQCPSQIKWSQLLLVYINPLCAMGDFEQCFVAEMIPLNQRNTNLIPEVKKPIHYLQWGIDFQ